MQCDEDGWLLQVNNEPPYQTFFHQFSPNLLKNLKITGKVEISYVGFGSQSKIEIFLGMKYLIFDCRPSISSSCWIQSHIYLSWRSGVQFWLVCYSLCIHDLQGRKKFVKRSKINFQCLGWWILWWTFLGWLWMCLA